MTVVPYSRPKPGRDYEEPPRIGIDAIRSELLRAPKILRMCRARPTEMQKKVPSLLPKLPVLPLRSSPVPRLAIFVSAMRASRMFGNADHTEHDQG